MHLYQGTTQQFIADATQARLANQLSDRFFDEFRYPDPDTGLSWELSADAALIGTLMALQALRSVYASSHRSPNQSEGADITHLIGSD